MSQSYDENNIFAKMLRKEINPIIVYENQDVLAFMDLMPQSPGHILVIPRIPSRNLLDAKPETLQTLILYVQKIAQAARIAFEADGISIRQYNETASGQTIFHLHFHIIPHYNGHELRGHAAKNENEEQLKAYAEKIKKILQEKNEV